MSEEFNYNTQNNTPPPGGDSAQANTQADGASIEYGPDRVAKGARKKRGRAWLIALLVVLAILVSTLCGVGGILIGRRIAQRQSTGGGDSAGAGGAHNGAPNVQNNVIMQETDASAATLDGSATAVVEKCAASVVEIIITADNSSLSGSVKSGAGSGVIIGEDEDGEATYIVTNNHVIEGNVSVITVKTVSGEELPAQVVGADWMSDIAVLRIEKTGFTKATWASSTSLKLGQSIVAIGNPLGSLGGSVSRGIISGVERTITVEGVPMKLLQIDAAINPGNSGGGLFDLNGNLVGIVNAKTVATNIEGIGFAIPSDYAKAMAIELAQKGYVEGRVDLGLNLAGSATVYGLPINSYDSSIITSTEIRAGDFLYSLQMTDGTVTQISSLDQYRSVLARLSVGDTVKAVIHRTSGFFGYTTYEVTLTAVKANP